jgi:hypothetical protein
MDSSLADDEVRSADAPPEKDEKLTEVRRDRAVEKAETYDSSSTASMLNPNSVRTTRSAADTPPPPSPVNPSTSSGNTSTSLFPLNNIASGFTASASLLPARVRLMRSVKPLPPRKAAMSEDLPDPVSPRINMLTER